MGRCEQGPREFERCDIVSYILAIRSAYYVRLFLFFFSFFLLILCLQSVKNLDRAQTDTCGCVNWWVSFLQVFSVAISVSLHVCSILDLILISMFQR